MIRMYVLITQCPVLSALICTAGSYVGDEVPGPWGICKSFVCSAVEVCLLVYALKCSPSVGKMFHFRFNFKLRLVCRWVCVFSSLWLHQESFWETHVKDCKGFVFPWFVFSVYFFQWYDSCLCFIFVCVGLAVRDPRHKESRWSQVPCATEIIMMCDYISQRHKWHRLFLPVL